MSKDKNPRRVADNEARAKLRMLKTSPQKLNLVAALIRGKKVTCHNNLISDIKNMGGLYQNEDVVVDGKLVTGRSGGHAHLFAHKIIEILGDVE